MKEIKLMIDGRECTGRSDETILAIAERNGIDIPTLCHNEHVRHYGACGICLVEAEHSGKQLRSCSTTATDGMVIHTESPRVVQARKIALELLMSDHDGDCRGPCTLNCPAGTDCQAYLKAIADGKEQEAVRIIKEKLPLPASIGRVCPHPCETACRRKMVEAPLSIAYLKSYAADKDLNAPAPYRPDCLPDSGKSVGIIGGGPGGLTAAYFLRLKGHRVTVYDAMPHMGGMLRYGIPEYRLPKAVLDAEIASIRSLGVKLVNDFRIGENASLEEIKARHDALIVAIGAWKSSGIACPGENFDGVWSGIDLLREIALGNRPNLGTRVAVIGGGNTAMDACRSAVRLGAKEISIIYRRTKEEMPAEALEILEAEEEGVCFRFLRSPVEITATNGHVSGIKLQLMELGEADASGRRSPVPVKDRFELLPVDSVIAAIGQKVNLQGFEALECNRKGNITADENSFRTSVPGVFAIGDATNKGADIAIAAIGEANKAAEVVDAYLRGQNIGYTKPYLSQREVSPDMLADREKQARAQMPCRSAQERKSDFKEINLGLSEEEARKEAGRCLSCGCHDYADCQLLRHSNRYPIAPERFAGEKRRRDLEQKLLVIERDQGKCILCNLCVRICEEDVGQGLLGLVGRGFGTVIKPEFRDIQRVSLCRECKKCALSCPTGALKILE